MKREEYDKLWKYRSQKETRRFSLLNAESREEGKNMVIIVGVRTEGNFNPKYCLNFYQRGAKSSAGREDGV